MARYRYKPGDLGRPCSKCGDWKHWPEYSIARASASGYDARCRVCKSEEYQNREAFCVVYSVVSGGMLKIGVSTTSEERTMQRYRTGSPLPVRAVLWTHCADADEAWGLEKELKVILKHRHSHGEWYHLHEEHVNPTETYHTHAARRMK